MSLDSPRKPDARRLAQILAVAVQDSIIVDIREAFRNAIDAGLKASELKQEADNWLRNAGMKVEFMDQPNGNWMVTTYRNGNPDQRVVVPMG